MGNSISLVHDTDCGHMDIGQYNGLTGHIMTSY